MNEFKLSNLVEDKLFSKLSKFNTKSLIDLWNETEKKFMTVELANIRGAIMKILEARYKKKYDEWMSANYPNDDINLYFGDIKYE